MDYGKCDDCKEQLQHGKDYYCHICKVIVCEACYSLNHKHKGERK